MTRPILAQNPKQKLRQGMEEDGMAISKTTFEERIARINQEEAEVVTAVRTRRKQRRSLAARLLTFPSLVGISILTGGAAYAWAATQSEVPAVLADMPWVLAIAG